MSGFHKNSGTQAADPPAAPKTAAKAKKDFFSRGQWVQDRLASFGRNTGTYHTLGKTQTYIYIYEYIHIYIYISIYVWKQGY